MNMQSSGMPSTAPEPKAGDLDDQALVIAIDRQREMVEAGERALAESRAQFDRARGRLKALTDEQRRRVQLKVGLSSEDQDAVRPRKRRSTTGMDALQGRDNIDPGMPFSAFRLFSLQRQEILLQQGAGEARQAIGFVDSDSGALREAHTFGEARALLLAGHSLGRPGVPLQRQFVWYVEQGKPGRLRLDQLFVEPRVENL